MNQRFGPVLTHSHPNQPGQPQYNSQLRTREGDGAHAPVRVHIGADHVELRVAEGVHPQDRHGLVRLGQVPPAQNPQERGLARAVGADEEAAVCVCACVW